MSLGLAEFQVIREGYAAAWSVKPGQEWLLSAAGTAKSGALKHHRRKGRAATLKASSRIAFFEWCIEEEPGGGSCVAVSATHLPDGLTLQGEQE